MKNIFLIILFFVTFSVYGQFDINSDSITGSSIKLNNLSRRDVSKLMEGSIFDVFDTGLNKNEYNTDLKKNAYMQTEFGQELQRRLELLRGKLRTEGIRTIQRQTGQTTRDAECRISNYDVSRGGFVITLDGGFYDGTPNIYGIPGWGEPRINGFDIKGLRWSSRVMGRNTTAQVFIPVPINSASAIEGNEKISVQLFLSIDAYVLQKIRLINEQTNEVYAEADIEI